MFISLKVVFDKTTSEGVWILLIVKWKSDYCPSSTI